VQYGRLDILYEKCRVLVVGLLVNELSFDHKFLSVKY